MVNLAVFVGITGSAVGLLLPAFSMGLARLPFWAERRKFALVAVGRRQCEARSLQAIQRCPAERRHRTGRARLSEIGSRRFDDAAVEEMDVPLHLRFPTRIVRHDAHRRAAGV